MTNINDIRQKIISIKNIQNITRAMEKISASKMKKTQNLLKITHPYFEKIFYILQRLIMQNMQFNHPYLTERKLKCIGYVIISTNRGLTGGLNINLFKKVLYDLEKYQQKNIRIKLALIGLKAISFFSFLKKDIIAQISNISDTPKISEIMDPIKIIINNYNDKNIDKIYIAYNKFVNTMMYTPKIKIILPLNFKQKSHQTASTNYLYEPDFKSLFHAILPRYIESMVYQFYIENLSSEQAARMIAMKSAMDNSTNLIKELNILYNKKRQSNITQELIEIISGSNLVD
ncbi:F1 sector of membrane-bound ATP synthase, gamma subunit [Wigglesworthia glossinidia endosymbiont of Glossina morsitans morsitans (Yale colony)]|uniref:ATP synthase gamma chain n=1 Tax=Wigglesworthia glossinidia endosymbiont of Glossina morsitans morsitans (Yale colony) TaxID=1142511 RepID=H6Q486_WIGGL|nr:ATP synthase F1 subunit gamma [Wigglesworthia glossinidia]AFA40869.1 F1 sector of membrane-bound ATP synthase, gamma subunit [Wigglesworthia glossinidia endosymbiont of Glossina morsitans morsitans (Yale colony)]